MPLLSETQNFNLSGTTLGSVTQRTWGYRPKAVIVRTCGRSESSAVQTSQTWHFSYGIATISALGVVEYLCCATTVVVDAGQPPGSQFTGHMMRDDAIAIKVGAHGGNRGLLAITDVDDTNPAAVTVDFEVTNAFTAPGVTNAYYSVTALGGDDVDFVLQVMMSDAFITPQDFTGFANDFVAGIGISQGGNGVGSSLHTGAAFWISHFTEDDLISCTLSSLSNTTPTSPRAHSQTTEFSSHYYLGFQGGNQSMQMRGSVDSLLTDGFRVAWNEQVGQFIGFLGISGNVRAHLETGQTRDSIGTITHNIGFTPVHAEWLSPLAPADAVDTLHNGSGLSIGGYDGNQAGAQVIAENDGAVGPSPVEAASGWSPDHVYRNIDGDGNLLGSIEPSGFNSQGASWNQDVADPSPNLYGVFYLGNDAAAVADSAPHASSSLRSRLRYARRY